MRTKLRLRPVLVAGAAATAIGVPAAALTTGTSLAQSATVINLNSQRLSYGGRITVTGTASATAAGQRVALEFAPAGGNFKPVASSMVKGGGSFRLQTRLFRSGIVRAVGATGATATGLSSTTAVPPSASQAVTMASKLELPRGRVNALGGSPATVQGSLLPGLPGRLVELQGRSGGAWRTLARARTGSHGRFGLRFTPAGLGSEALRVRFSGDSSSSGATASSGMLTVYRQAVASWYNDGGSTACGFHATMGVASPGLPCGSKVTFLFGGRRVTATVDDRGPFVGGRSWDLNQNTAGALGFAGVATVWASA